jgi:5-methyltetrahydropteroyltriglutamate--homocysteine methyltransferase
MQTRTNAADDPDHARGDQRIFVGVIDPINPRVETPEAVRDRVLEAADYIPPSRFGTRDDCGFAPFGDHTSTARQTAFEKIRARIAGTELVARTLGPPQSRSDRRVATGSRHSGVPR